MIGSSAALLAITRATAGEMIVLIGSVLILISAIGVIRFPDALTRMHALYKASTLGVSLALAGAALAMTRLDDVMSLAFAAALQAFTNPVAATLLTRATYYANEPAATRSKWLRRLRLAEDVEQTGDDEQQHHNGSDVRHDSGDPGDAPNG